MSKIRVAVLMGGTSSERAISLSTGRQIVAALDRERYVPMAIDAAALSGVKPVLSPPGVPVNALPNATAAESGMELVPIDLNAIASRDQPGRPDVVLIALHGRGGEDGTIQGMLELLGIPYTGSGVLASALAMDKAMTKRLLRAEGIPVPGDIVVRRSGPPAPNPGGVRTGQQQPGKAVRESRQVHSSAHSTTPTDSVELPQDWGAGGRSRLHSRISSSFGYPVIVKPNTEGSTIGCTIVRDGEALGPALEEAFKYDSVVLVEQFVTGVEITAGLLGNEEPEVLPLIEIVAKGGFYDYEAKYAPGGSSHIIPARIPEDAADLAREYARRSHTALGCRGMSRVDMIVSDGQPIVLEVNTIPGMTPTSLLPDAARAAGISFSDLLDRIIASALHQD